MHNVYLHLTKWIPKLYERYEEINPVPSDIIMQEGHQQHKIMIQNDGEKFGFLKHVLQ